MLWILLFLLILLVLWILLSPLEIKIDTRVPVIIVRWKSIGNVMLLYENEVWWLKVRVLFFSKEWDLMQIILADRKKKKKKVQRAAKKSGRKFRTFLKVFKILETFQIVQWEIALSWGDPTRNAYWYWLNFFPLTRQHVRVNFVDENYLVFVVRNKVWRMVKVFLK